VEEGWKFVGFIRVWWGLVGFGGGVGADRLRYLDKRVVCLAEKWVRFCPQLTIWRGRGEGLAADWPGLGEGLAEGG
jgi:hypothetical protein